MPRSKSVAYFYRQTLEQRVTHAVSKRKNKKRKKKFVTKVRKKERVALRRLLQFANEIARARKRIFGFPPANCVLTPAEVLNKAAWGTALAMEEACGKRCK